MTGEHAEDVLRQLLAWLETGQSCALVVVTDTTGGAVRAPGALLAVGPDQHIGYISGGCIDADVCFQARQACELSEHKQLRYGAGSPFVDLPLPCGGAIEVQIIPAPDRLLIETALKTLVGRQQLHLSLMPEGLLQIGPGRIDGASTRKFFHYAPKLRMRIAGRGADALALAKISEAAGYDTICQLLDDDDINDAKAAGLKQVQRLTVPTDLKLAQDDEWTAFVLLFHDQDWEIPLLQQALTGSAFYIGAVGSRTTHERRCLALKTAGSDASEIVRVRGPIGLVPSLRDASFLAISTLAEIVDAFPGVITAARQNTAVILLAAGASSRFEEGDKLLADLNGKSVLEHASTVAATTAYAAKLAITPGSGSKRSDLLQTQGWEIVGNPDHRNGQASSLRCGLDKIKHNKDIDQVILLLGDMPHVPSSHLKDMLTLAEQNRVTAIMSDCEGVLCPPALFKRVHFEELAALEGDRGAKSVFMALNSGAATLPLDAEHGRDIDCVADLKEAEEVIHA
ncbi:MAG: NTP transferase domain-containing protein [Henriciella sp.]